MNTILLLAADPEVHHGFRLQLEKFKLRVHGVFEIAEAKQHLEAITPALFLVDLDHLADSFVDCYHWIGQQPQLVSLPRIFISGRESRGSEIVRLLEEANEAILKKPLQRSVFLREIKEQLKRHTRSFGDILTQSMPKPGRGETDPSTPVVPPQAPRTMVQPHAALADPSGRWLGKQVGSVMLQKEIGRGGMGAVYLGFQSTLNRKVAVKMILPELINNATMMARFQREALAMARLKSPYVVQVYDAGYTDDGTFFMVMEYLEGQDLEERIRQHGPLGVDSALSVMEQVLEGLIVAHDAGIIHRDLKPSNLIMTDKGHTTVTDFGLAQQHSDLRFTREGAMLGTPYYFAPEQANGEGSDARSDIYSLGIVLYELLVGIVPFPSSNLTEVLYQHAHKPIPDPRRKVPSIPGYVVALVETMAAKRPEQRYPDAHTALKAVREARGAFDAGSPTEDVDSFRPVSSLAPSPPVHTSRSLSDLPPAPPAPKNQMTSSSLQMSHSDLSLPIDPERRLGAFTMSVNGTITPKDGSYAPVWADAMQILQAVLHQLEAVVQMGPVNYALCEGQEELLLLMNEPQGIEGMVFALNSVPSTLRMSLANQSGVGGAALSSSVVDPLVHLSSTAGVEGLMLLTSTGVLRHHVLPAHINAAVFASQVSPLTALFASLPVALNGVDCCFERGRALLWKIDQQYLVVLASHRLNKSLLAILLEQQRALLRAFVPSGERAPLPHGSIVNQRSQQAGRVASHAPRDDSLVIEDSQASVVPGLSESLARSVAAGGAAGAVLSKDEIAAISKEFARFIGPMAKLLVKQEAKKLGFSSKQVPQGQAAALIKKLSAHLDADKRQSFLDTALNMIQ